ncbi:MAG: Cof-type HAD-IIB family hydrolase [Spirochaetota bacterium]
MFRLLVTDIDDTLLAADGSLPPENHDVLNRLHARGVTIVFCSGRSDLSIQRIASPILEPADDEYYIAFNGARTVTAASRRIVSRRYVSPEAVARVVSYAHEHGLHIQGYTDDDFLVEADDEYTRMYAEATKTSPTIVPDLAAALPGGSPKLLIVGEPDELVPHRDALARLGAREGHAGSGGTAGHDPDEGFVAMFSKPKYLEVVAAGVNKGDAVRRLASVLGVPVEETIAVGDGDNDVEMIRSAGTGLAVASAHASAREAADVVLESGAQDAAFVEIERRFFA